MSDGFHSRSGDEWATDAAEDVYPDGLDGVAPTARRSDMVKPGFSVSRKLAILSGNGAMQAESIASLRSHLQANHLRDGRRSLAICAAKSGSGTSYIAANLAVALSMAGAKTLLIDGNLRAPSLSRYLAPERRLSGLSDYLSNESLAPYDVIQHDVLPHLSVVYAGTNCEDAPRLLAGPRLDRLLDTAMRDFDVTLVDTPPSSSFGDARRIAAAVHHAMIVTRKSHSYVADVRTLIDELKADRVNVIGSFLNQFNG